MKSSLAALGCGIIVFLALLAGAQAQRDDHQPRSTPLVAPALTFMAEGWRNTGGGVEEGGWWNTLVGSSIGINGRAFGASENSQLFAHVHWVRNRADDVDFASRTGAFHPVSGIAANDHVRVFNFYYRYTADGERWAMKVGQIAVDDDFMLTEYSPIFLNSAFGAMPSQTATPLASGSKYGGAFAMFPVAVPGIWVEAKGPGSVSFQVGLYHGGPGPDDDTNAGFKYESLGRAGAALFAEASWSATVARRPATMRVGLAGHSGKFDDLRRLDAGVGDAARRGLVSFYFTHDVLLAGDADAPKFGAFARVGASPLRNRSAVTTYVDAGVAWFGPLPQRNQDVLGLAVSTSQFGRPFRAVEGLARAETAIELTYKAHVAERLSVQADVQWLFNPAPNATSGRRETALVAGVRSVLEF